MRERWGQTTNDGQQDGLFVLVLFSVLLGRSEGERESIESVPVVRDVGMVVE